MAGGIQCTLPKQIVRVTVCQASRMALIAEEN